MTTHLEEIKTTPYAEYLTDWLEVEIEKMKDISTIKTLKELQARQEAEKILKKLFYFLDFKSKTVNKTKYN